MVCCRRSPSPELGAGTRLGGNTRLGHSKIERPKEALLSDWHHESCSCLLHWWSARRHKQALAAGGYGASRIHKTCRSAMRPMGWGSGAARKNKRTRLPLKPRPHHAWSGGWDSNSCTLHPMAGARPDWGAVRRTDHPKSLFKASSYPWLIAVWIPHRIRPDRARHEKTRCNRLQRVFNNGRSGGIRTRDPLLPKQMRYQTALRSDKPLF